MFPRSALVSLLLALGGPLVAHPHVWADVKAEVSVAAGYVEGVWTDWTFDEVFSQLILMDHDLNGNGKVEEKELPALKKGYFDNLKGYRYFTHLRLGAKKLDIPAPTRFTATVSSQGRVTFRFFVPLGLRLDAKTPLAMAFYDDTFFTDMVFSKSGPVTLKVTDGGKGSVALRADPTQSYYSGQVVPTFAFITWSPS